MTLYVIGSFFPGLAARDRVNVVKERFENWLVFVLLQGNVKDLS
jgi:hypothetical protein